MGDGIERQSHGLRCCNNQRSLRETECCSHCEWASKTHVTKPQITGMATVCWHRFTPAVRCAKHSQATANSEAMRVGPTVRSLHISPPSVLKTLYKIKVQHCRERGGPSELRLRSAGEAQTLKCPGACGRNWQEGLAGGPSSAASQGSRCLPLCYPNSSGHLCHCAPVPNTVQHSGCAAMRGSLAESWF